MKKRLELIGALVSFCLITFDSKVCSAEVSLKNDSFNSGYKAYLKKDFNKALGYWTPLAEAGNLDAQYHLGMMFLNGQGVNVDLTKAVKWFKASGAQGDPGAQFLIGEMNLKGMGLIQDYKKAGSWFKKSAEQGYPDAQYRLGEWYADGKGGITDLVLAYVWLKLAGANGIQAGDKKRERIENQLTFQEIKQADKLAFNLWNKLEKRTLD